jgi:predicted helicase
VGTAAGSGFAKTREQEEIMPTKKSSSRKYGDKASEKVERAMHEKKRGTLRSGSGKKVTSRKQAIAIGLSEARKAGGKVPAKKR